LKINFKKTKIPIEKWKRTNKPNEDRECGHRRGLKSELFRGSNRKEWGTMGKQGKDKQSTTGVQPTGRHMENKCSLSRQKGQKYVTAQLKEYC
jgi:hypothetical protein